MSERFPRSENPVRGCNDGDCEKLLTTKTSAADHTADDNGTMSNLSLQQQDLQKERLEQTQKLRQQAERSYLFGFGSKQRPTEANEKDFIRVHFHESVCQQFTPCSSDKSEHLRPLNRDELPSTSTSTNGEVCSVCGLTRRCHDCSQSSTTSFGFVAIPSQITSISRHGFRRRKYSKYLRFKADLESDQMFENLWKLLTEEWKFTRPCVILSLADGSVDKNCRDLHDDLLETLTKLVNDTNVWIISDGRNYGASGFIGELLAKHKQKSKHRDNSDEDDWLVVRPNDPVLIGISHWGSLKRKELLYGISQPDEKASNYFLSVEHELAKDKEQVLDPYQSAYLLLDNGSNDPKDYVQKFRTEFVEFLSVARDDSSMKNKRREDRMMWSSRRRSKDFKLPLVTLVLGGHDEKTIDQIRKAVERKRPVVIVKEKEKKKEKETSDIPMLLAELFFKLDGEVSRAWKKSTENTENMDWFERDWFEKENEAFEKYIKDKENTIRTVFHIESHASDSDKDKKTKEQKLKSIDDNLLNIMKKRHYITVIDYEYNKKIGQDPYSSFLRGIYKGYEQHDGLKIALQTCHQDFLEALFNHGRSVVGDGCLLTVSSLHELYVDNVDSNVLKKVLKLDSYACMQDREETCKNCLPYVGRILHRLLGARYKILYHEEPYLTLKADNKFGNDRKSQMWHLLLWSVLNYKPVMTQYFVLRTAAPLGAALVAYKLYSRLAEWANDWCEFELNTKLQGAAAHFQEVAVRILDNMYDEDREGSYRVLISELPFGLGQCVTAFVIADDSRALDFMSHRCCQTYLLRVWRGNMFDDTPAWKSLPIVFPLLICGFLSCIHFEKKSLTNGHSDNSGSGESQVQDQTQNAPENEAKSTWINRCYSYFTAPVTKFYVSVSSFLAFLTVLTYFVLTDLKPYSSVWVSTSEWVLIIFVVSDIVEELLQVNDVRNTAPVCDSITNMQLTNVWRLREKLRARMYPIELYISNGRWNGVDITIIVMFLISFLLRYFLPLNMFQIVRVFFAVTVIICYFRLLRFLFLISSVGPRIIAIEMMLTELVKFMLVLAVFIVGFGVAFQAILHPYQSPSWSTLVDILYRPFWQMFGELFLDDLSQGMGVDVSDTSCVTHINDIRQQMHNNDTVVYCVEWAAPVLLGVYLLIANVLLINLLIAIFSEAFERIKTMSDKEYHFYQYSLISDCYYQPVMPPPFSLIQRLHEVVWGKYGCPSTNSSDDSFCIGLERRETTKDTLSLQKRASTDLPRYGSKLSQRL